MEQEVTKKPNNPTRIILIVVAVLLLACCACSVGVALLTGSGLNYFANNMIIDDPTEVAQITGNIIDYQLPPEYTDEIAMNLFGMGDMVFLSKSDDTQVITFIQLNSSLPVDSEQLKQQMLSSIDNSNTANFTQVDEFTTTIRGQQVPVQVFEGESNEGVSMHQLTTTFDGKYGLVFLIVTGESNSWNQAEIEDFFASIQ